MSNTKPKRPSTENNQPTEHSATLLRFPRHPLTDWNRYQPVNLDPKDRPDLLAMGWQPVPLVGKACYADEWSTVAIDEAKLAEWLDARPSDDGTGIRCGKVSGIDVDILKNDDLCSDVAHVIEEVFGSIELARRGSKGFLVPLLTPEPLAKRILTFTDKSGKEHKIEWLAKGQQFGTFSHVPAVEGKHGPFDYSWFNGESPLTQYAEIALPLATVKTMDRFFQLVEERLKARGCAIGIKSSKLRGKSGDMPRGEAGKIRHVTPTYLETIMSWVSPDVDRNTWIGFAGALHNTVVVDAQEQPVDFDMAELWGRFCRGDLWRGKRDGWMADEDGVLRPSAYRFKAGAAMSASQAEEEAARGFETTRQKEGGTGFRTLEAEARKNGYDMMAMDSFDTDDSTAPVAEGKTVTEKPRSLKDRLRSQLLTSRDYAAQIQDYDFAVDQFIPASGYTIVLGKRGSGKTILVMDLLKSLATDQSTWMGEELDSGWYVVGVVLEDKPGVKMRDEAWHTADPKAKLDPARFKLLNYDLQGFRAETEEEIEALMEVMREDIEAHMAAANIKGPRKLTVWITTWQRFVELADKGMSDDTGMARGADYLESFAAKFCKSVEDRCFAIIEVHPPKANEETTFGSTIIENKSGSILTIATEADKRTRTATLNRSKAAEEGQQFVFTTDTVELEGRDRFGKLRTGAVACHVPTKGRQKAQRSVNVTKDTARRTRFVDLVVSLYEGSQDQTTFTATEVAKAWLEMNKAIADGRSPRLRPPLAHCRTAARCFGWTASATMALTARCNNPYTEKLGGSGFASTGDASRELRCELSHVAVPVDSIRY